MHRTLAVIVVATLLLALAPHASAAPARIQASTWIIMDADTGEIIDSQRPHHRTPMASLTKLMTALVAVEQGDLQQPVTIQRSDLVGQASAGLRAGETLPLEALLYALLLPSGNDAANAIARAVGGGPGVDDRTAVERFIGWMNARAESLGMTDTHFVNPHGLDRPGHHSSVYDLAVLTRAVLAHPTLTQIIGTQSYSRGGYTFRNTNKLLERYPGLVGGKTGWTYGAGLCLVEVAERADRRLIVVLINSTAARWFDDAADLLDRGFALRPPGITPAHAEAIFTRWRDRTDGPHASGHGARTWIWGPEPIGAPRFEPYQEGPDGERLVGYFDKGRMEITDPAAPRTSTWYVTGGRLAWEMITGQRQVGNDLYEPRTPARVPLAGDPDAPTPTYATLRPLLRAPATPAGEAVTQRLVISGRVDHDPATASYGVTAGEPYPETGHGVASVFTEFLSQRGPVFIDGWVTESPLFDPPLAVTGYPITEPYWVRAPVGGVARDVLVQCFERRCLTYTPDNPAEWQVEMANIGRAYLDWLEATPARATAPDPAPQVGTEPAGQG